jgi:malate synthase
VSNVRDTVLSPAVQAFLMELEREFGRARRRLLHQRIVTQQSLDQKPKLNFPSETVLIRSGHWVAAEIPSDLLDRRVEITGPVDRKMVINALNSGANAYMADFEDSHSPTWEGTLNGQLNLRDAIRRQIDFTSGEGKRYSLQEKTATLHVRPRGWHLDEKHFMVDGQPISAGLFDFGTFFFHNAIELLERGKRPYFYLPKMESYLEARLWNDVFLFAQDRLGSPQGSIRATALIETLPAAFQMDEILYELREHSAGLNCGRWDYIFSFIKKLRAHREFVLPDRSDVTMTQPCMKAYTELAIQTCHRRRIHCMGGMAAYIPIKNSPEANASALQKVAQDKLREASAGHDGTWVAHPGLVQVARDAFAGKMPGPNQISNLRQDVAVKAQDLLQVPAGKITWAGLRQNIQVGVQYLDAWLHGNGCVPLFHLMEDAATAEISRAQIWQWIHHGCRLETGESITPALFRKILNEVTEGTPSMASQLFDRLSTSAELADFLTVEAYHYLD